MKSIIIVDQTDIPSSFEGSSLFVFGVHIADSDEHNEVPLLDMAGALAKALDTEVRTVKITQEQLAKAVATKLGRLDEFEKEIASGEENYEYWNEGYTNDHVLDAIS